MSTRTGAGPNPPRNIVAAVGQGEAFFDRRARLPVLSSPVFMAAAGPTAVALDGHQPCCMLTVRDPGQLLGKNISRVILGGDMG